MSLGALSREAHETLAIALNRIGGKSNSGEVKCRSHQIASDQTTVRCSPSGDRAGGWGCPEGHDEMAPINT